MKKTIIILAIVAVLGISGYIFYSNQVEKLMNMRYKFLAIKNVSVGETAFDVKVRIESDSTLEAQVTDLDLDVFVNGRKVGKIVDNSKMIIPAKGYSVIDFKVIADLDSIGLNALNLAGEVWKNKDATLTLRGKAKVKTSFISFRVPIDYTESIKYLLS